jgi:hypothetical protein
VTGALTSAPARIAAGVPPRAPAGGLSWRLQGSLAVGRLGTLELRQEDLALPPPPRPGDERLGTLAVRGVEPLADGRGWLVTVEPLAPGPTLVPALDLGDGRRVPELRVAVPRTVPYGAPWMALGGGTRDQLPPVPFPWAWTLLLLLPLALLGALAVRGYRRGVPARMRRRAGSAFQQHWPPRSDDRAALEAAHAAGRDLLAAHFGPEARSWDFAACRERGLAPWGAWIDCLDRARFAGSAPPYPPLADLLASLAAAVATTSATAVARTPAKPPAGNGAAR